jgi:hypothetical protein
MPLVLERIPGFQERWEAHLDWWGGEEAGLCNDIAALSEYVRECITEDRTQELPAIFALIEEFMTRGDEEVRDATATCFLENLLNITSEEVPAESYIGLLGNESKAYGRAWDRFTGVRTEGLWRDNSG